MAGHFAERYFAERHFADKHFAERTFCPLKFLYFRQVVVSAKCLFGEKSVRQTVRSTKCSFDKVSIGKMSVRQNVFRQSVFRQSVFRQNVRVPRSDSTLQCMLYNVLLLYTEASYFLSMFSTWPASIRKIPTRESFSPDKMSRDGCGTEPDFVVTAHLKN